MKVELINQTNYADIFGVYDASGKPVGTVERRLAGRDVGTYAYSLSAAYTRRDILRVFRDAMKGVRA